jgi:hypothetical protein
MLDIGNGGIPHFRGASGSHFPTDLLEMEEVQGSRHFQISSAISADMEASQTGDVVNSSMTKTESR